MLEGQGKSLVVLGYSEAAMFLRRPEAERVRAMISIAGQREHHIEGLFERRLDLRFDDVPSEEGLDEVAAYRLRVHRRKASELGLNLRPPGRGDAEAIIDFARSIAELDGLVLCHCGGGISRAPAAALLSLATWFGAGRESDAVRRLLTLRPAALPHDGLVRLGDAVLERGGALVAAATRSA